MKVLFVSWDGPQVSYLEGLFLPIFKKIAETGIEFHILQFTWGDTRRIEVNRQACVNSGFNYHAVSVWRRPLAAGGFLTAIFGSRLIRQIISKYEIDAIMPRSTLPALATMIALRSSSLPMIFDADGLPLDERVDFAGQSPTGLVHRILRDVEAQAVRCADLVMTRTNAATCILQARAGAGTALEKFHIVSNGRNVDNFKPMDGEARKQVRGRLKLAENVPLIVYAGSIGPQYCVDEMIQVFSDILLRKTDAHFLILTGTPELVADKLEKRPELIAAVTTMSVSAFEIPEYLACADMGLAFRRPSFSMQGVAPIKLGEYLLCGIPVVSTPEIAVTASMSANTGFLVRSLDKKELSDAANWFVDKVLENRDSYRARCREAGLQYFSLESSAQSYISVLSSLPGFPSEI